MEFTNKILTLAGTNLIAQATSANKLVFVKAVSSTQSFTPVELLSIGASSLQGPEGVIKTTSATNNVARVIVEFTNQTQATNIKTIALIAKLSTQSNSEGVVFAVQSDANASVYLPNQSAIHTSIQIAFNIAINATESVAVNQAANVSLGDFERLMERTVTTHVDGDASEGENQEIRGTKRFLDGVESLRVWNRLEVRSFEFGNSSFFEPGLLTTSTVKGGTFEGLSSTTPADFYGILHSLYRDDVGGLFRLSISSTAPSNTTAKHVIRRGYIIDIEATSNTQTCTMRDALWNVVNQDYTFSASIKEINETDESLMVLTDSPISGRFAFLETKHIKLMYKENLFTTSTDIWALRIA